jgi:hypothetical protein
LEPIYGLYLVIKKSSNFSLSRFPASRALDDSAPAQSAVWLPAQRARHA